MDVPYKFRKDFVDKYHAIIAGIIKNFPAESYIEIPGVSAASCRTYLERIRIALRDYGEHLGPFKGFRLEKANNVFSQFIVTCDHGNASQEGKVYVGPRIHRQTSMQTHLQASIESSSVIDFKVDPDLAHAVVTLFERGVISGRITVANPTITFARTVPEDLIPLAMPGWERDAVAKGSITFTK